MTGFVFSMIILAYLILGVLIEEIMAKYLGQDEFPIPGLLILFWGPVLAICLAISPFFGILSLGEAFAKKYGKQKNN